MKETVTANGQRILRLTAQADDIADMCQRLKEGFNILRRFGIAVKKSSENH